MNKRILMRASTALDWTLLTFLNFFFYNYNRKLILQFFLFSSQFPIAVTPQGQTCVQWSPLGTDGKVTVIKVQGNRYIQVNFAENIPVRELKIFGKLSGAHNIQGDCYIQV